MIKTPRSDLSAAFQAMRLGSFFWKEAAPFSPTLTRLRNTSATPERRAAYGRRRRRYQARCWSVTKSRTATATSRNRKNTAPYPQLVRCATWSKATPIEHAAPHFRVSDHLRVLGAVVLTSVVLIFGCFFQERLKASESFQRDEPEEMIGHSVFRLLLRCQPTCCTSPVNIP